MRLRAGELVVSVTEQAHKSRAMRSALQRRRNAPQTEGISSPSPAAEGLKKQNQTNDKPSNQSM
jgi:hypothetical protein